MREAVGGSMLMYILIPVFFVFIFFIAFIMNYASAYRASNYIISKIETCDAKINDCDNLRGGMTTLYSDVKKMFHYDTNKGVSFCYNQNTKGTVYRVTLRVAFDLPLVGRVGVFPVVSESKTIYNVFERDNHVFGNIGTGVNISECS